MESIRLDNRITVIYPPGERDAGEVAARASERSLTVIRDLWGLKPRYECHVFIMTSWLSFMFAAAPWYLRPIYLVSLPLWFLRIRKLWPAVGGWTQHHWHAPVIGVKPPRLIAEGDSSIGKMLFIHEPDMAEKMCQIVCHELTHALSGHLKLPVWLNEGIAMVAVDTYSGSQTVRDESLDALRQGPDTGATGEYKSLSKWSPATVVYQYARAYWLTRFLVERHPEVLKDLLIRKYRRDAADTMLSSAFGIPRQSLWENIDGAVLNHFGGEGQHAGRPG